MSVIHTNRAQQSKPFLVRARLTEGLRSESHGTEAEALAARDRLFAEGARSVYVTAPAWIAQALPR